MKNIAFSILLLLLYAGCNTIKIFPKHSGGVDIVPKEFYELGEVTTDHGIQEIPIEMVNGLPICRVQINGKDYRFLIDTGSLTVVSEEIFEELDLPVMYTAYFGDFSNKSRLARHAVLPSLKINNLEFKGFGCVILDIDETLKCFYDGVIGANLMAHLNWKFDYQKNKVCISAKLSDLAVAGFDFTISFRTLKQKNPLIDGIVKGKTLSFLFDTGYSGGVQVQNEYDFYRSISSEGEFVTSIGIHAIGFYGASGYTKSFTMKTNLQLGQEIFANELVTGGAKALFGNDFLKNFVFTVDWVNERIYFKRNLVAEHKTLEGFGFSPIFIEKKLLVGRILEAADSPLKLGDEIVAINGLVYTGITDICDYLLKDRKAKDDGKMKLDEIDILIKRNSDTLNFQIQKQIFIK